MILVQNYEVMYKAVLRKILFSGPQSTKNWYRFSGRSQAIWHEGRSLATTLKWNIVKQIENGNQKCFLKIRSHKKNVFDKKLYYELFNMVSTANALQYGKRC